MYLSDANGDCSDPLKRALHLNIVRACFEQFSFQNMLFLFVRLLQLNPHFAMCLVKRRLTGAFSGTNKMNEK